MCEFPSFISNVIFTFFGVDLSSKKCPFLARAEISNFKPNYIIVHISINKEDLKLAFLNYFYIYKYVNVNSDAPGEQTPRVC